MAGGWGYLGIALLWIFSPCLAQNELPVSPTVPHTGCDRVLNHFPPLANGNCPEGTEWVEYYKCCVKCIYCLPGTKKKIPGCHAACEECETGSFSLKLDQLKCTQCTVCESIHRTTAVQCQPTADAVCGACLPGYYSPKPDNISSICKPCESHLSFPECQLTTATPSTSVYTGAPLKRQEDEKSNPTVFIIVGVLVFVTLVAILVGILCWKWRRKQQTEKSQSSHNGEEMKVIVTPPTAENSPTEEISEAAPILDNTHQDQSTGHSVHFADPERKASSSSSEEEEYLPQEPTDRYVTALTGMKPDEERNSYHSMEDEDDDGAAAWGNLAKSINDNYQTPPDSMNPQFSQQPPSGPPSFTRQSSDFSSLPQNIA